MSRRRNKNKNKSGKSEEKTLALIATPSANRVQPTKVPQQKKKKRGGQKNGNLGISLSPCAWKYARALLDPFNCPQGACMPTWPSLPSLKQTCISRGTFAVGTASVGFVTCNPFSGISRTPCVTTQTTSGYTGTTLQTSTVPIGMAASSTNALFSSAGFGTSTGGAAKLIGAGLRVRYIGSLLYRKGMYSAIMMPNHATLEGLNEADVSYYNKTVRAPVDGNWITVLYTPIGKGDYDEYVPGTSSTDLDNDPLAGQGLMGIMVTQGDATYGSFEFEFIGHYEMYTRNNAVGNTPSDSDAAGMSIVTNLLGHNNKDGYVGSLDMGRLWNSLTNFGIAASSYILTGAATYLTARNRNRALQEDRGPMIEEL